MPDVEQLMHKNSSLTERLPLPTRETLPPELVSIAEAIAELTGTWNPVELYTPGNAQEEKTRFVESFLADKEYNPVFTYPYAEQFSLGDTRQRLKDFLHQVRGFEPKGQIDRLGRVALRYKIKDDLATLDLIEGLQQKDEEKISRSLAQKYQGVNDQLWQTAQEIYEMRLFGQHKVPSGQGSINEVEQGALSAREFSAEEIASALQWALKEYGMFREDSQHSGFAVTVDEKTTSIDVRDKSAKGPTVFIPKQKKMNGIELLKLIGHEIEGHARQSINGERLFLIGGGSLKVDDETLYEGLAKRNDDQLSQSLFGTEEGIPIPHYTYAVRDAMQGKSFSEIFQGQLEMRLRESLNIALTEPAPQRSNIPEKILQKAMDQAWMTTFRVMRGHVDTSNKRAFAMTKDLSYLQGWLLDRQLRKHGLGHLNEAAIIARGGLQLLAEFQLSESDLPLPYRDVATKFWQEVLKPQLSGNFSG